MLYEYNKYAFLATELVLVLFVFEYSKWGACHSTAYAPSIPGAVEVEIQDGSLVKFGQSYQIVMLRPEPPLKAAQGRLVSVEVVQSSVKSDVWGSKIHWGLMRYTA